MRSPGCTEPAPRTNSSRGLPEPSPVRMARASLRSTSTGVRLATSVSSSMRLTCGEVPTMRPTRPCSLMTGLPILMPRAAPMSSRRALEKGPRESETDRAVRIGTGGSGRMPSMAS